MLLLAVLVAMPGCGGTSGYSPVERCPTRPTATTRPAKVQLTIGKDTTYITGPLNADGTVNYVAHVNAKLSEGVTPRNNAAVMLFRAIGPRMWAERYGRAKVLKLLGMPPLPAEGEYFVPLDEYVEGLAEKDRPDAKDDRTPEDIAEEQVYVAMERPWSANDYPVIAAWLKANAKPLALVVSASRCSHCYIPLVSLDNPAQWATTMTSWIGALPAGKALVARAMLELSQGHVGPAWSDLMAARRLARLISRGATLIEGLVGLAIEDRASAGCTAVLAHDGLSAEQSRTCLADLKALAPLPDIRKTIAYERFTGLDAIMAIARTGGRELPPFLTEAVADGNLGPLPAGFNIAIVASYLDWDEMMRVWNDYFDRWYVKGTMRDDELETLRVTAWRKCVSLDLVLSRLRGLIEPRARTYKRISRDVAEALVVLLFARLSKLFRLHMATVAKADVLRVAAALRAYKAGTGGFPAGLANLAPKYLKALPKDRFSDKALVYRRQGDECVVYSVGENRKDDGGVDNRYEDDVAPEDEKDDIAIRFER